MLDRTEQPIERTQLKSHASRNADRPSRIANNAMNPLAHVVARFCGTLARFPDGEGPLTRFSASTRSGRHFIPSDLSAQAVQIRRHLVHLGIGISQARSGTVTDTQRSLQRLQHAYRGLQGLMIGVPDRLLDHPIEEEQHTIRQLLYSALASSQLQARAIQSIDSTPPLMGHIPSRPLSMIFECGELIQRSVIEAHRDMPDFMHQTCSEQGGPLGTLIANARLDGQRQHLRDHRTELSLMLKAAGHRRTVPMRLAHRIFLALGDAEGAMIGAETQFESTCQPLIDLIAVRTNELARYC